MIIIFFHSHESINIPKLKQLVGDLNQSTATQDACPNHTPNPSLITPQKKSCLYPNLPRWDRHSYSRSHKKIQLHMHVKMSHLRWIYICINIYIGPRFVGQPQCQIWENGQNRICICIQLLCMLITTPVSISNQHQSKPMLMHNWWLQIDPYLEVMKSVNFMFIHIQQIHIHQQPNVYSHLPKMPLLKIFKWINQI